jgi:raffinose/stachyose/melibiose transport system permease protein
MGGLKNNGELYTDPFGLPTNPQWDNYMGVLRLDSFWQQVLNSTLIMVATVSLLLIISSMTAFIFARVRFPGSELLFNIFTIGLLFPLTVAILPLYIVLRQLNLIDTLWGVILPSVAFGLPANIVILRGFFKSIPLELEEASFIDGCTLFGFYWRIMIPLSRGALASVGMLTLVASWNGFFLPLLVLNKDNLMTLPLGIMQYQGQYGSDWGRVMAFVTIALIPAVIFYLLAERNLVAGLTEGAVKS